MSPEKKTISIVTPSFNQGAFIEEAIQSVVSQGFSGIEHIIVDNCSTDETPRVLARYPHLKVISEPDQGQSDALNKGFRLAKGELVGWLNADDRYWPGCFQNIWEEARRVTDFEIYYGDYYEVDEKGRALRARKELSFDMFMLKYLHVLCIPTAASFFRRRIFEEGNFLEKGYQYAMDYEFFLRLALRGYRFRHIEKYLADFRWHENSKSQKATRLQIQEREAALAAHDPFLRSLREPQRAYMRKFLMLAARGERCFMKLCRGAYFA